jgi:hypothetical protein
MRSCSTREQITNAPFSSEGQETGAITLAPENDRKICLGAWSITPVKKTIKKNNT